MLLDIGLVLAFHILTQSLTLLTPEAARNKAWHLRVAAAATAVVAVLGIVDMVIRLASGRAA